MNKAALFKQLRKSSQRLEGYARKSKNLPEVSQRLMELSEELSDLSVEVKAGESHEAGVTTGTLPDTKTDESEQYEEGNQITDEEVE